MSDEVKKYIPMLGWFAAALGTAFGLGAASQARWSELPERVTAIETWRENSADPALRFLVCSQRATNIGQDATRCDVLLVGLPELLGQSKAAQ